MDAVISGLLRARRNDYRVREHLCVHEQGGQHMLRMMAFTCALAVSWDLLVNVGMNDGPGQVCVVLRRATRAYALIGYAYIFDSRPLPASSQPVTLHLHPADLLTLVCIPLTSYPTTDCIYSNLDPTVDRMLETMATRICGTKSSSWAGIYSEKPSTSMCPIM